MPAESFTQLVEKLSEGFQKGSDGNHGGFLLDGIFEDLTELNELLDQREDIKEELIEVAKSRAKIKDWLPKKHQIDFICKTARDLNNMHTKRRIEMIASRRSSAIIASQSLLLTQQAMEEIEES